MTPQRADVRFRCKRCEYRWRPRVATPPKKCPQCGSPYWDRKRTRQATVRSIRGAVLDKRQGTRKITLEIVLLLNDMDAVVQSAIAKEEQ